MPAIVERVVDFASERGIPRRKLENLVGGRAGAPVRGDAAHAVLAYVVRELADAGSLWDIARRARPGDYGAYGFAIQASETLGDALLRGARFFASTGTTAEFAVATGAKTARILVRRRDGAKSPAAELGTQYVVGQIVRLIEAITNDKVRPRAIHLATRPPNDPASFGRGFGVVPQFSAPMTAIELDRDALEFTLPRRDPELIEYFERELGQKEGASTWAAVRRVLTDAIALGASTAEEDIARALGVGTRTLRRQLAEEGTTMRQVFDGVRLEIATDRLRQARVSLADLAFQLGFSDQTALSRAFRRWTGRSPAAYHRASTR